MEKEKSKYFGGSVTSQSSPWRWDKNKFPDLPFDLTKSIIYFKFYIENDLNLEHGTACSEALIIRVCKLLVNIFACSMIL